MNCNDCNKKRTCVEPCDWLIKELKKVTTRKKDKTFTEVGFDKDGNKIFNEDFPSSK